MLSEAPWREGELELCCSCRNDVLGRSGAEIALQSSLELRQGGQAFSLTSSHWIQAAFSFKLNRDALCPLMDYFRQSPLKLNHINLNMSD